MSDCQLCRTAGVKTNYLAQLKCTNLPKYHYTKRVGIKAYEDEAVALKAQLGEIYWMLMDNKNMTLADFFRKHMNNIYSSAGSFSTSINNMAFKITSFSMRLPTMKRVKYVIEQFEIYERGCDDKSRTA